MKDEPDFFLRNEMTDVSVISRGDIRAITSVLVDGQQHFLGEHRDFRRNANLHRFIPEEGRYSFSWVRLRNGEVLDNHEHPTKSMILVCHGSVHLAGDTNRLLVEGDAVCVPPGKKHGFRTEPNQEFYGLSIQFEGEGLYENEIAPRVGFISSQNSPYADLDSLNKSLLERHSHNSLFKLFETGVLRDDVMRRKRFMECLYVWSRYFQKMLHARQAFCTNDSLLSLYTDHLREEFGHDELLRTQNGLEGGAYDPALESASLWFVNKMLSADESEKIVVVHMVVESSGHLFGNATKDLFPKVPAADDSYFEVHAEADDGHSAIGRPYLQHLTPSEFPKLMETCRQAWHQMDIVHERIAALTLAETPLTRRDAV
jgi:quercetin dioxygenase-like cupin family protein